MIKSPQFDIVIPVHKKDLAILEYCIEAARSKIVGARRIITISQEKYTDNAEWFAESQFPFSMDLVRQYTGGSCGWYFQQLLKLYAPLVVPDILENVLILDSDTVFFRKTKMFDDCGRPFYNISKDTKIHNKPFDIAVEGHINKLWPKISRQNLPVEFQEISGVCHSMMFNRNIITELFDKVEKYDGSGDKFFKIFLKHASSKHCASEYQIYFNFLLIFHSKKIAMRKLRYKNTADLNIKKYRQRLKYSYCSFHSYLRNVSRDSSSLQINNFFKKIWHKLFIIEQRNIGIANCNIGQFLTMPNQKIYWLKSSLFSQFRANPFALVQGDKKFIFFEKYDCIKKNSKIAVLEIVQTLDNLRKTALLQKNISNNNFNIKDQNILEEDSHPSRPYIFSYAEKNYALIANHQAKEIALYEVLQDLQFKKIKVIFNNLAAANPAIIFYENKFWLFFSLANQNDAELYICYADSLDDQWKMHPKNPIKNAITAPLAGEIFIHNGALYRPAQNCAKNYGAAITINKITQLTPEEFIEVEEIEITPNQLGQYPLGIYNISSLGKNLTVVDGGKRSFILFKALICLAFKVQKIFNHTK